MRTDKLLFSESSGFVLEAKPGLGGQAGGNHEGLWSGADGDRIGDRRRDGL